MRDRRISASHFLSLNLAGAGRRFGAWWLKEALELVPDKVLKFISPRGRRLLAVGIDGEVVRIRLLDSKFRLDAAEEIGIAEYLPISIDRFLDLKNLKRRDVEIGLWLSSEDIFVRKIVLPREAKAVIKEVIAQDLAKKTPFKSEEIYTDYAVVSASEAADKIAICQWVVKRTYPQAISAATQINMENVSFVVGCSNGAQRDPPPFINLRANSSARVPLGTRALSVLSCLAMVLIVIASGLTYWRQQTTLDELNRQIGLVKVKALEVRATADRLQEKQNILARLRIRRGEAPGLLELWEEITRVLPSHTWLNELKLIDASDAQHQQVSITGFSSAATGLVGVFDNSPLFSGASLMGPVALDTLEGRERFSLQARVKAPDFGGGRAR